MKQTLLGHTGIQQGKQLVCDAAGDVVLAVHPDEPAKIICKRLIASAGQTIQAPSNLDAGRGCHVHHSVTIPRGHVWLSGDNLAGSVDSRSFGAVPCQLLLGRPILMVRLSHSFAVLL
jgi:mitochondrial inner membrane protease subunit 1